ncbi:MULTISPECIES: response regulator transcription factor [Streptomyces]|uniref:Response regulator transcription factor n=2 Tax=Streptomyces rimosus subsp. rimosus TaxID=132474 RepID=L8EWP9_STRR1|nr:MULTISPECIES: response regulator transcription factor [Streptomyces]KOG71677.1 LuxR family transcriptional regulator [Kitasatospora aureofaciens]MYT47547.1 response regulator [Streptomyces sp. SID5471]KEF05891.1 LuxR family transcriptional regulator [Streptomyces rimosus]KEF17274.1 LuxR family transcriptional regulator [Streptomyces rimosus]KOT28256.1 LuxR family transcriptional regulator [Streptomyces sp. NRRL WC-3701]
MRVVIAEDSAILRDGLVQLLALRGVEVAAAVGDAESLRAAVAGHRPDAAVVDIRLPPGHTDEGLRAAVAIRRDHPGTGVLIFSQYVETKYATQLLGGGAAGVGYLLKERVVDIGEFVDALERVAAGGTALDPEVVTQFFGAGRRANALDTLTPREREVLAQMAQGRTNQAIAAACTVTERAVEKHIAHIFTKLDLPPSETDHRRVLAVLRYMEAVG